MTGASAVKYLSEFTEEHPKNENAVSWLVRLKGSYEELFLNYEEPGDIVHNSMVVSREGKYGLADGLGGGASGNGIRRGSSLFGR